MEPSPCPSRRSCICAGDSPFVSDKRPGLPVDATGNHFAPVFDLPSPICTEGSVLHSSRTSGSRHHVRGVFTGPASAPHGRPRQFAEHAFTGKAINVRPALSAEPKASAALTDFKLYAQVSHQISKAKLDRAVVFLKLRCSYARGEGSSAARRALGARLCSKGISKIGGIKDGHTDHEGDHLL